jgi:aspartate aminotransferase-like enzyme
MQKKYLMTPGPTPVPADVLAAQALPMIHHRTPEFNRVVRECAEGLKAVFGARESDVLMLSCSGTGAMEAAVANCFCAGDAVIVCQNGKFGQRMAEIAAAYALDVTLLSYGWQTVVAPADVAAALEGNPDVKGVLVVQSDTSSGVLNDVAAIGEVVRGHPDCVLIVDSITGIGAVECKTDEWGLDVVMTGSQKGLMMPPGLAACTVSPKAWRAYERSTLPKYYFDWKKYKKSLADDTTPFTPPVSLMRGLAESLRLILDEGVQNVIARHALLARAARAGCEAIGLELFAPPEGRGSAVTPVWVPEGIDGKELVRLLKGKYGVTVAGGQDEYAGRIFRIGHLGYIDRFDIITVVAALEMALRDLGYKLELGSGVRAAEEAVTAGL